MKFSENLWLGSVAARDNILTATNFSTAFFGNAALQSVALSLSAPRVFWSALARAMDANETTEPDNMDSAPVAEAPALTVVETPVEVIVEETAEETAEEAEIEPAEEVVEVAVIAAAETADGTGEDRPTTPSPLLLDAPRGGVADDLTLIKGIGAKMQASLNEFGIYHFDQIAGLDEAGIDWLDENLSGFKRSCARFDLVAGAKALSGS